MGLSSSDDISSFMLFNGWPADLLLRWAVDDTSSVRQGWIATLGEWWSPCHVVVRVPTVWMERKKRTSMSKHQWWDTSGTSTTYVYRLTWVKQIRDVSLRDAKSTTRPCGLLKWHKRLAFRKFTWKPNMAVLIDMWYVYICNVYIYVYKCMYSHRYT